jgi:hypothetical protein
LLVRARFGFSAASPEALLENSACRGIAAVLDALESRSDGAIETAGCEDSCVVQLDRTMPHGSRG